MNFLTEVNYSLFIWSVCTFVESHVREEINMEELARQTGFSPVYVCEVFRRRTGKPLARYIQERKIANAHRSFCTRTGKSSISPSATDIPAEQHVPSRTHFP